MGIKKLFTVPDGEKVTEKALHRVLVSSICSILLCMVCLVSTTWAWFTVSIENTENVIQIANITANVEITSDGQSNITPNDGKYTLNEGTYEVTIKLEQSETNAAGPNVLNDTEHPVYVVMVISRGEEEQLQSFEFTSKEVIKYHRLMIGSGPAEIRFYVSWAGVQPIDNEATTIGEIPTETTEPSTEATSEPTIETTSEPSTEATSEPTIEPTSEPTTEATSEPTTEKASEPTAETTEPTTEATSEATTE